MNSGLTKIWNLLKLCKEENEEKIVKIPGKTFSFGGWIINLRLWKCAERKQPNFVLAVLSYLFSYVKVLKTFYL